MSASRFGRIQKATALIPLALLSAAATASVSGVGFTHASADPTGQLPDGTDVPAQAIEAPASVSLPPMAAPGGTHESTTQIVATASAASIPAAALAAYQRAETVINRADPTCRLAWQLVAAIGRVESNHGRANGNLLDADGVARPGIVGPALDGQAGTSQVTDTDGGQYDGDTAFDRAVGPMQFIPSTWSTVGVDADGDGQRNPQDINDSALASAVYLCSGEDDLSSTKGQSAAVYRYNHSASYVATVLAVMRAYEAGDFTSVPNYTVAASYFVPDYSVIAPAKDKAKKGKKKPGTTTVAAGAPGPVPAREPEQPSTTPPKDDDATTPTAPKPSIPTSTAVAEPVKTVAATTQQLVTVCTNALTAKYSELSGANLSDAVGKCVGQLQGKTLAEAQAAVGGVVAGLAGFVNGLLDGLGGGLLGN